MHLPHLLSKMGEGFVLPRSRICLEYAPSARLELAGFGWRNWTKPSCRNDQIKFTSRQARISIKTGQTGEVKW